MLSGERGDDLVILVNLEHLVNWAILANSSLTFLGLFLGAIFLIPSVHLRLLDVQVFSRRVCTAEE